MKPPALLTNAKDNVATVIKDIKANEKVILVLDDEEIIVTAQQDIPIYHKIALCSIAAGEDIVKYGEVIGRATADIKAGDYVHVHNVESMRGRGDLSASVNS